MGVPIAAAASIRLFHASLLSSDRSIGRSVGRTISRDTREIWEAESANGGTLERSPSFFPLSGTLLINARAATSERFMLSKEERNAEE